MHTQRATTNTVNETRQLHKRTDFEVSEVNYQHIARSPPVCRPTMYMTGIMHNGFITGDLQILWKC